MNSNALLETIYNNINNEGTNFLIILAPLIPMVMVSRKRAIMVEE